MPARLPLRISDLIRTDGWTIKPYISALGIKNLAEAQVLFVDSNAVNALDADDGVHGRSLVNPLATWDYAVGLCTAGESSIILLAPRHNEDLGNAQIDLDVTDVHTIGMGRGLLKPRIDFGHANSSVNIGANNVSIDGINFLPAVTDVLIGVDVESGVTGFRMSECEFLEGEDGSNVDEFVVCVDLKSGNNDSVIKGNTFRSQSAAAGCTTGIMLTAASSRVKIEDNVAVGNFSTAFVDDGAACPNIYIANNTIKVKDGEPGIELTSTTTGIIKDNKIESTGLAADSMIVAAGCSWFNNTGVTADGSSAEIIGLGELASLSPDLRAYVMKSIEGVSFPIKFWWVDANASDDTGDGKTPASAKQTLDAVLTLCENTQDDWIFVYDYSGSTNEIVIANSFVHIIGCAPVGMPYPRFQASTSGEAGLVLGDSADRVEIANVFLASTGSAAGIEFNGAAGSYGCWIHDCQFGRSGNTCGQDGINIGAGVGGAAPYLLVENCKFGSGVDDAIVRDGIRLDGNSTGGIFRNNTFQGVGGICINFASGVTGASILDNTMALKADGIGDAVDLNSSCSGCVVSGNKAQYGDNYITAEVFRDQGSGNEFGQNDDGIDWRTHRILDAWFSYANKSVPGSAMPRRFWYVDANITASGNGRTPDTAFKTIAEAITVCTSSTDDWVFVFDYSGGGSTILIDTPLIHLIGNMGFAMPYPRIKPSSGAGIELQDGADRVEICGFTIGAADQSNAAIVFDGDSAAGAYGCWIHDNVIGRDADAPCLYGIQIASGGAAPYLRISNNRFIGAGGSGIAAAGSAILFTGNATRCVIEGNRILDVGKAATPAIWLAGGITEPTIIGNHIKHDTDTSAGAAITLGASVDDGWVADNFACDGKDTPSNSPYKDGASTNGWAGNKDGDGFVMPG